MRPDAGVWLRKKPMDLGACMSEARGRGEGGGAHSTRRCVCPAAELGRLTYTIVEDTA